MSKVANLAFHYSLLVKYTSRVVQVETSHVLSLWSIDADFQLFVWQLHASLGWLSSQVPNLLQQNLQVVRACLPNLLVPSRL